MAITTYATKDGTGAAKNLAVSDLPGGGTVANAFYVLVSGSEAGPANPVPVSFGALPAGTNNIGDVDVLSLPALPAGTNNIGDVDVLTLPALPAGTNNIGKITPQIGGSDLSLTNPAPVRGLIRNPSATLTLPNSTTTYAVGDLVANSATAAFVTALSWDCGTDSFLITGISIKSNRTAATTVARFRLHLYSAAPTVDMTGDRGVFGDNVNMGSARYLGAFDFGMDRRHKDGHGGSGVPVLRPYLPILLGSGTTIYGLVEARDTYGRSQVGGNSETMTITLDLMPNS